LYTAILKLFHLLANFVHKLIPFRVENYQDFKIGTRSYAGQHSQLTWINSVDFNKTKTISISCKYHPAERITQTNTEI